MSRMLRNGRAYDPNQPPPPPKPRKRKNAKKAEQETGEQAVVKKSGGLTFGTAPLSENFPDYSSVIVGTGRHRGVLLVEGSDVTMKMSPSMFQAIYKRAPPIKKIGERLTASTTSSDARQESDAPAIEAREATPTGSEAADRALVLRSNPHARVIVRAPAALSAPVRPVEDVESGENESVDESNVYYTARTSRVREHLPSDDDNTTSFAQYMVEGTVNNSPTPAGRPKRCKTRGHSPAMSEQDQTPSEPAENVNSWAEEVRRAEHSPERASSLPDIEPGWVNPNWSRHLYESAPTSTNDEAASETTDQVAVNALIYELGDDYVFSEEQYTEVLRNLRSEAASTRSQTSGAGPSFRRRTPKVTVEDVAEEDEPVEEAYWTTPPLDSTDESSVVVGKGKGRAKDKKKKKKKSQRKELGVEVDDLRKVDKEKAARRRSSGRFDLSRVDQTPPGFKSGGYLELMHGDRARPKVAARSSTPRLTRDEERTRARPRSVSRDASERSRHTSGRRSSARNAPPPPTPPSEPPSEPSDDESSTDDTYHASDSETDSSESESDPDSSDSSSSDDGDKARKLKKKLKKMKQNQKRLEQKIKTQARSGYKAQPPKAYDGEADFDKFEQFVFNYDNFSMDTHLGTDKQIRGIGRFLDGKASIWYMANVAPNLKKYTMKQIYQGLFDYCFPSDFRESLRRKYMKKHQNDQNVQDYFAELNLLKRRLKVTDEQHVQRAWDGAARYIKGEWALKGISPENTTIDELRETALDIERAHKIRRSMDQYDDNRKKNKRDRSRSPDRRNDRKKDKYKSDRGKSDQKDDSKESQGNKHGQKRASNWNKPKKGSGNPKAAKSDKQKDEFRAANKCFECAEVGHLAKDCPSKYRAKPSGLKANAATVGTESKVRASAVFLEELQRLTDIKESIEVSAVRVDAATANAPNKGKKPKPSQQHVERNAVRVKDLARKVPQTLIVQAKLEGESVRVLLDCGSQADLVSSTIVDQLRLNKCILTKPLQLQMAMAGSRGMLHHNVCARIEYQTVDEQREFDIANLDNYDMILGTPFLYQHSVRLSFNPNSVYIGSPKSLPLEGDNILLISSIAADVVETNMETLRQMLIEKAQDLCKTASETDLPPFRKINHVIPLINPDVIYDQRPSRCSEALKPQFKQKAMEYIQTGRWQLAAGTNAIPMLFLSKKSKDGEVKLRTVLDKRQQNANTKKLASPLPNIEDILAAVSKHKYKSLLDGKDAYEQIRVVPEDVPKTLFNTPMGTMVSLVMQQGDCNAGATYQAQMNHMFSGLVGRCMYVYLDDIVIFSDTIEQHIRDIEEVMEVLRKEKFYLSPSKMQFFARILHILGHVIDEKGIRMDPNKVDSISKWKTPTSKDQLASYLGALGYLAPNCPGIRIPMAVLTKRASGTGLFRWEGTEERAFRETQRIVEEYCDRHRVALRYEKDAPMIYLITDASLTGASGFVSQGDDWQTAPVAAFWSGKFNTAQQNYSVTDREALAIISSLQKFQHLLHGARFEILTDHKALEYLMTQKNLSARQARWLDTLSQFDFKIRHIEGSANVLADALSRIYSDEAKGTVRAGSEYVQEERSDDESEQTGRGITNPVLTGLAATVATESGVTSEGVRRNPTRNRVAPKRYDPEIPGIETRGTKTKHNGSRSERSAGNQIVGVARDRSTGHAQLMNEINSTTRNVEAVENFEDSPLGVEPEGENTPQTNENDPTDASNPMHLVKRVTEIDVIDAIRKGYENDTQFGRIYKDINTFISYRIDDGLLYMIEHGRSYLCVPDTTVNEYNVRALLIAHAHSILSHLGNRKTYGYMRESMWWKSMSKDVETFCNACTLCASSKTSTQKPYGLLKPLPVPEFPWSQISVDFMGPLPMSRTLAGEFDMICVVVDHLTAMTHIIPTRQDYMAKDIAKVMYTHVYRLHGLPDVIVSDRDKLFTSQYHRELHALMGTELKFSSSFHPQTDGKVERMNRSVMSVVRTGVNPAQRDWAIKLPGVEFAINMARSETTGLSPFALNYGWIPRPMLVRTQTDLLGVQETARQIKYTQSAAHDAIIAQRPSQMEQANKRRRLAPFKPGDFVFVSTKNISIPEGKARKLAPKYIGPYKIEETIKEGATYRVELPPEMRRRGIRPMFHASLLKPHVPSEDLKFPGRKYQQVISLEGDEDDWTVDKIANHRGKGNNAMFELVWQSGDRTWEPLRVVKHLEVLRQYFEALGVSKASELPWKAGPLEGDDFSDDNGSEILEAMSVRILKHGSRVVPSVKSDRSNQR